MLTQEGKKQSLDADASKSPGNEALRSWHSVDPEACTTNANVGILVAAKAAQPLPVGL